MLRLLGRAIGDQTLLGPLCLPENLLYLALTSTKRIYQRYPSCTQEQKLYLLGDNTLDAIAISTPTKTHFNIAKQALEAGKHVLVEKPLADNLTDSQELTRIAAKKRLVLMVGHVFQYNAALMKLKEIINSGELGDIYYLSFVRTNLGPVRTDVNALWDLMMYR